MYYSNLIPRLSLLLLTMYKQCGGNSGRSYYMPDVESITVDLIYHNTLLA